MQVVRQCYDERLSRQVGREIRPNIIYDANEHAFGADPCPPSRVHSQRVSWPTLSYGLLTDLIEVVRIKKRYGIQLTAELINSFRDDHLTTIQEFIALGHWRNPTKVVPNFRATDDGKDVDWKFEVDGVTVLLEVKFRRTDWRRGHPETLTFKFANLFEKIADKFPSVIENALRVAHVVVVQPPDHELLSEAERFSQGTVVDAVVVESINGGDPVVVGREAARVSTGLGRRREFPRPEVIPFVFARPSIRHQNG